MRSASPAPRISRQLTYCDRRNRAALRAADLWATRTTIWFGTRPYVNLVVDQQSLVDALRGSLRTRNGHLFLRRLVPRLPNGLSRTPHSSLAVTDYPTAFDEGFAIHFQGLARYLTQNAKLQGADRDWNSSHSFLTGKAMSIDRCASRCAR